MLNSREITRSKPGRVRGQRHWRQCCQPREQSWIGPEPEAEPVAEAQAVTEG